MELGGIHHDRERVFLISTTHGAENHSLAAARATLKIFREQPVVEHIWSTGKALIDGFNAAAAEAGIGDFFQALGVPCNPYIVAKDRNGAVSLPLRTIFLQELIKHGIIANNFTPNWSHSAADVDRTAEAARSALRVVARALDEGWEKYLDGSPTKPVFRTYN